MYTLIPVVGEGEREVGGGGGRVDYGDDDVIQRLYFNFRIEFASHYCANLVHI